MSKPMDNRRQPRGNLLEAAMTQPQRWTTPAANGLVGSLSHMGEQRSSSFGAVGDTAARSAKPASVPERHDSNRQTKQKKLAQFGVAVMGGLALLSIPNLLHRPKAGPGQGAAPKAVLNGKSDAVQPLSLPHDAAEMQQALRAINSYNYAPYQGKKTAGVKRLQSMLAQLEKAPAVSVEQRAQLAHEVHEVRTLFDKPKVNPAASRKSGKPHPQHQAAHTPESKAKAAAQAKPQVKARPVSAPSLPELHRQIDGLQARLVKNDKLAAVLTAKWAAAMMPKDFHGALAGKSRAEIAGMLVAFMRIESMFTTAAEYLGPGIKENHARGFVQLQTETYFPLLLRHRGEIKLPPGAEHAFDDLYKAVDATVDAYAAKKYGSSSKIAKYRITHEDDLAMAALGNAPAATQKLIREALIDRTAINFYGEPVPRGGYLSCMLAQFYLDSTNKTPAILRKFGNVPFYLKWQMGESRFKQLLIDMHALEQYSDKAVSAAANRISNAKIVLATVDTHLKANRLRQQAVQVRNGVQPSKAGKRAKQKQQAKPQPLTAAAKQKQAAMLAQLKPLQAEQAQLQKQRAAVQKQLKQEQERYTHLQKPLKDYNQHMLYHKNKQGKLVPGGQATNNPMWKDPKTGDLLLPHKVFEVVRDGKDYEMHKISTAMTRLAQNIVTPLANYGISDAVVARMPQLLEIDNHVVYRPAKGAEPLRPTTIRVGFNKAPKPAG